MIRIACILALVTASAYGQASLSLSLAAPNPSSFTTTQPPNPPSVPFPTILNVVRTESLAFTLVTTPTVPVPPPAQLLPRRLQVWIGAFTGNPLVFPEGAVWIDLAGMPIPQVLVDSFGNPFAPTFGPALQGATNTIALNFGANLFLPNFPLPSGTLCIQAFCEDVPGQPLILSNPVLFTLVDPQTSFAPTITDINPKSLSGTMVLRPQGPESGGNSVTITGTNFLAQSNWIQLPPTIRFGTQAATNIIVINNTTIICTVPPTSAPTMPPNTAACLVDVTLQNNLLLSPLAATALSPVQYLYLSGQTPNITGFVPAAADPEGGQTHTIQGSGFLNGLKITLTSVSNPSLTTTIMAPPAMPGPGGTTISFTTPPFCTGDVNVLITNCDEVLSNVAIFPYVQLQPSFVSGTRTFTADPSLGGQTFISVVDIGSPLTITGNNFLTPASPLATAPTVPPASFFATMTSICDQLPGACLPSGVQTGLVATNRTTITGTTNSNDQTGTIRPQLGFKRLEMANPPCVATGNAAPIGTVPCTPNALPCTIVRQDQAPPGLVVLFPLIVSTSGCVGVRLTGSNMFTLTGRTNFDYTGFGPPGGPVTSIPVTSLTGPAVRFGTRFSPKVTFIDEMTLLVDIPPAAAPGNSTVNVTVFNPDGQASVTPVDLIYVPALTDPMKHLPLAPLALDTNALLGIAMTGAIQGGMGASDAPAILFAKNPSPTRDRARDPTLGATSASAADFGYVFLFNTRLPPGSVTPNAVRTFNFDRIDVPATIILPAGTMVPASLPPIDPTISPAGTMMTLSSNLEIRVIFKAVGFDKTVAGNFTYDRHFNHPLFLQSHGDFSFNGILNLAGDSLVIETLANATASGGTGGAFRARVDRTFPPAGGARGGRGGAYFPEGLVTLPGPNFGVSPTVLQGGSGEIPSDRFDMMAMSPLVTFGRGGLGTAPVGVQSGGGGGAGSVTTGLIGQSGSAPGGFPGALIENTSAGPAVGRPNDPRLIFGNSLMAGMSGFPLFPIETALASGFLYGGSGGGGGGGGFAIFIPSETLGGRGGNGGGSMVLLADCILTLGANGCLWAFGEQGLLGVDIFPVFNGPPTIPLNVPGAGGGGAGGTIFAASVSFISIAYAPSTIVPPLAATAVLQSTISTQRGLAGPRALGGPSAPATGVLSVLGGDGSDGRLRFVVNSLSPYQSDVQGQVAGLFGTLLLEGVPPSPGTLATSGYFFYLSQ